jgi:DNA-binding XRE family transcriptional regulator
MSSGGTIYAIGAEGIAWVKIGSTRMAATRRLQELQIGQPFPLTLLATVPVDDNLQRIERQVHAFLAEERRRGEWFEIALDAEALAALVVRAVQYVQVSKGGCMPDTTLGKRVRQTRRQKDLTQKALGGLAGINPITISRLEQSNLEHAYAMTLRDLAQALGVSTDYLVGLTDDPTPHWTRQEVPHDA